MKKVIKNLMEKAFFALPKGWTFEESVNGDIVLMCGEEGYAYYDNGERTLVINAYYRDVNAKFYVCTNEVSSFAVKRQIMQFIDAEGSLEKGIRKGFILLSYFMSEETLEETMEAEAESIRPTAAGQECVWKARPDGITYLLDENDTVVTCYDRNEMTYVIPFSNKVVPIPTSSKGYLDEQAFREVLEIQAMNIAERMEGGAV